MGSGVELTPQPIHHERQARKIFEKNRGPLLVAGAFRVGGCLCSQGSVFSVTIEIQSSFVAADFYESVLPAPVIFDPAF